MTTAARTGEVRRPTALAALGLDACTATDSVVLSPAALVYLQGAAVRIELKRLVEQISVAMGEDDTAKAERLLERDLAAYLAQARDDIIAGEAVRDSFAAVLATRSKRANGQRSPALPPGESTRIARPDVILDDHVDVVQAATAREAALLVAYEQDGMVADRIGHRLDALGYDGADNYSTGLNRAKKAGWVTHVGREYYLTARGKEVAENLLEI